jgi:hypothetical protein
VRLQGKQAQLESSVRTPPKGSPDKTLDALLTANDEYTDELTFSPQTLERQRARIAKEVTKEVKKVGKKGGAKFHADQLSKQECTKKRLSMKKEKEFAETHTFQPDTKQLNRMCTAHTPHPNTTS